MTLDVAEPTRPKRMVWLDCLRGFAIIAVLIFHLTPTIDASASTAGHIALFVLRWVICAAGVPCFFIASLFLFFEKRHAARTIWRLVSVFAFWVAFEALLWVAIRHSIPPLDPLTLANGGPAAIAGSGVTIFWFLFDLICMSALAAALLLVEDRSKALARWLGVALLFVPLVTFVVFQLRSYELSPSSLWNFVPYVGLAYLAHLGKLPPVRWLLPAVALLLLAFDKEAWTYAKVIPLYGRASVVVFTAMAFGLLRDSKPFPLWLSRPLGWLGQRSLGIYALHTFIASGLLAILGVLWWPASASLTVALTLVAVAAMEHTPLRRFVM
jgi:surface polysaccharide O-acyltransferase-like enzyme